MSYKTPNTLLKKSAPAIRGESNPDLQREEEEEEEEEGGVLTWLDRRLGGSAL